MDISKTIRLLVDPKRKTPVYEEVHVEDRGGGMYRLLQSPGLTLGIAADDIISVDDAGTFGVVERGRNVCIQVLSRASLDRAEQLATSSFAKLGGRLDGRSEGRVGNVLVYTVSVDAGFPAIEKVLKELQQKFPELECYYGNVYDPADGVTPLDWWK